MEIFRRTVGLMGIIYNETSKTITLHTRHTSYQMKIGNLDYLLHLYYGPSIQDADMSYQIMQYDRGFSGTLTNPGTSAPSRWMPSLRNSLRSSRETSVLQALKSLTETAAILSMGKPPIIKSAKENINWRLSLAYLPQIMTRWRPLK